MISCIVPVYNNESTLLHVLSVLCETPEIDELIVVDDASKDSSAELMKTFKDNATLLFNKKNLGKGGALIRGVNEAKGDILLFCDADLSKLKVDHIKNIITKFQEGFDMVIAARESIDAYPVLSRMMATVSGERIFRKDVIEPYLDLISRNGNGIEQITNYAHRNKSVEIIISKDVGHIIKAQRDNPMEWSVAYAKEFWQVAKTEMILSAHRFSNRS